MYEFIFLLISRPFNSKELLYVPAKKKFTMKFTFKNKNIIYNLLNSLISSFIYHGSRMNNNNYSWRYWLVTYSIEMCPNTYRRQVTLSPGVSPLEAVVRDTSIRHSITPRTFPIFFSPGHVHEIIKKVSSR